MKSNSHYKMLFLGFLLTFTACFFQVKSVFASSLTISPIRIELTSDQLSEKLILTNTYDEEIIVEASVYRWQQIQDREILTPTSDIALSSEIFSISKGQSTVLLLGLIKQTEIGEIENSYRLIITADGLPQKSTLSGTRFSLNISVPIFLSPIENGKADIKSNIIKVENGTCLINIRNDGNRYIRLQKLTFQDKSNVALSEIKLNKYLLPGSKAEFPLIEKSDQEASNIQIQYVWGGTPNTILSQAFESTCLSSN